jgi:hypothetical protein
MANRRIAIPSKAVELKVVGSTDSLVFPRVQRLSITADRPSTDIDELGNRLHAGTVEDIPAITVTFQAMDVGIKLFSVLTGKDYSAYPASGVSITELKDIDVIAHIKSDTVEDYVKMAHARRCVIRDFTFTYTVDGESTEEYTAIGTKKRWFKNDVIVDKFTTGTTSFTLNETPVALKDGNKALSVILDGVYLTEVAAGPATGEYSISGTTLTTYDSRVDQCIAVYQAAPTGDNWTDSTDSSMPAAIRGMDVPVVIGAGGIERVQSVTINGTFNPEAVREMGNRELVGYQAQIPAVTGTITVLDTDTELIALLTTGQLNPSGVTEFGVSEFTASGIPLIVKLQDPADKVPPFEVVKTLYIPSISITNEGFTSNVNQNAQQTFDFKSTTGELKIYEGAMP